MESALRDTSDTKESIQRVQKASQDMKQYLPTARQIIDCAQVMCEKQSFSTMQARKDGCGEAKSYIGLAPCIAENEDEVGVIYKCPVPFIVRPVNGGVVEYGDSQRGGRSGRYELVSEAYVHDLMDGEAMDMEDMLAEDIILV